MYSAADRIYNGPKKYSLETQMPISHLYVIVCVYVCVISYDAVYTKTPLVTYKTHSILFSGSSEKLRKFNLHYF